MMGYVKSLGYALQGLRHAFVTERNLRLFGGLYAFSILLGWWMHIDARDWELLLFTGGVFLAIELMNTAIEHFSDAFDTHSKSQDDHHTHAIKCTKDIAAAASLVCLTVWVIVIGLIVWEHVVPKAM
jgi:diacylglycerol kinase